MQIVDIVAFDIIDYLLFIFVGQLRQIWDNFNWLFEHDGVAVLIHAIQLIQQLRIMLTGIG